MAGCLAHTIGSLFFTLARPGVKRRDNMTDRFILLCQLINPVSQNLLARRMCFHCDGVHQRFELLQRDLRGIVPFAQFPNPLRKRLAAARVWLTDGRVIERLGLMISR